MPHLLITRPQKESSELSLQLNEMGYSCTIEPLLSIESYLDAVPSLAADSPIIITSQHALVILAEATIERDYPLIIVGAHSATVARNLGFSNIEYVGPNSHAVVHYIQTHYLPTTKLHYLRGQDIATDLKSLLLDYAIDEYTVYHAIKATTFSRSLPGLMPSIDGVLFYSRRTCEAFLDLLNRFDKRNHLHHWACFCLSADIAHIAQKETWKQIVIAPAPTNQALLNVIRGFDFTKP